ncbi:hypothetical protein B0H10DRAFT_1960727 [Mycena sp. CBHHK59/15]|nr:hypothetical protein B0H10DRAFT_1960727 [Mycena sp. CBHHK59/15]
MAPQLAGRAPSLPPPWRRPPLKTDRPKHHSLSVDSHATPSSIACAPLLQMLPQASSPFAGDQLSTRPRSPPLLMPQDYQPTYPDFSQLSSSGYSSSQPLPSSEVPSMAQFARMVETLRPEQLAQLNQMLDMSVTPGSGTDHDLGLVGAHDNDYDVGQGGGDRDDDGLDDDPPDIHQNAQSSLEFTMHDVNVQRKRKRTRSVPQANGGSDSDESPTVRSQKRPRKKRANRQQKSRSIREIAGIRRSITEASYDFVQKRIAIKQPVPSRDAADDEFQAVTEDSWDDAVRHLGLDPGDFQDIRMEESLLPDTVQRFDLSCKLSQVVPSDAYIFEGQKDISSQFSAP